MISHFCELLILYLWSWCTRFIHRRRQPPAMAQTPPPDCVTLGTTIPSLNALPVASGYQPTPVQLSIEEKRRGLYILGSTGSGKTNLLLQLVHTDIVQGRGVFLLDFRGELVDRVLMILAASFEPQQLRNRLLLIDLRRDDYSVPFNPLREEAADAYTRVRFIMDVLQKQWEIGVQTEQTLRNSLLALSGEWSLYELEVLLTVPAFRKRVLTTVKDSAVQRFFARFDQMENTSAWIEPVLNKVSPWLARPVLRNILSQRQTISFHERLQERPDSIVLISLSADTLYGDANLMGSLLTSALMSAALRPIRRDRPGNEVCFYLDEFEHFDGLSEQFCTILSEGRKFGLCTCLSHQTSIQLSPKLRNLIRNVVGTQIFFSVGGGESEVLSGEIASSEPKTLMRNLLMNQKLGECTVVRRGQPYTRIRTRHIPDPDVAPEKVEALRLAALQHFGKPRAEIEAELEQREASLMQRSSRPASAADAASGRHHGPVLRPSPDDIILEVRDGDQNPPPKPKRARNKPS